MRVSKVAHASIVVETRRTRVFMDPVFDGGFGYNSEFHPKVDVRIGREVRDCDLIVLSHAHVDHFSPRTLDVFSRKTPIAFPAGESPISEVLRLLGFDNVHPLMPGDRLELKDLKMIATDSRVPFPEMGMIFESVEGKRRRRCWNMVDTGVDHYVTNEVLAGGPIDLLLATWQPLVETMADVSDEGGSSGHGFPASTYGQFLRSIFEIAPTCVVPASCGFHYIFPEAWNDRGFPMTEAQFLADIKEIDSAIQCLRLQPGDAIEILDDRCSLERGGLSFVTVEREEEKEKEYEYDWRPDREVPPLEDTNPLAYSASTIEKSVARALKKDFIARLHATHASRDWCALMRRLKVLWRLEIIFPGEPGERRTTTHFLDFSADDLAWADSTDAKRAENGRMPKLHTSLTASALTGMLAADVPAQLLSSASRGFSRLYEPHRYGVWTPPHVTPPLKIMFPDLDGHYLLAQAEKLRRQKRRKGKK